jgi:glycosyltransferase involved in cell wall biosynthesis
MLVRPAYRLWRGSCSTVILVASGANNRIGAPPPVDRRFRSTRPPIRACSASASYMTRKKKVLQITSYPPPRAGWGIRVQFLKEHLEAEGHQCVVLNIGTSRRTPSTEYETVLSGPDYVRKVFRYAALGFVTHAHVNGATLKGLVLTLTAQAVNLLFFRQCYLTFHAGIEQIYFPKYKAPALVPVFWAMFNLASRIICNSEDVKTRICAYGVPGWKVVPIPAFSRQYLEFTPVPLRADVEEFYRRFSTVLFSYIRLRPLFYPEELIIGFDEISRRRPDAGLLLCGASGNMEGNLLEKIQGLIAERGLHDRVCLIEDFAHDEFLTALGRSALYVRTHVSDGVCSSVLEALSLGVPVVAAENGTRPPGVRTYPAQDPAILAAVVNEMLDEQRMIARNMPRPQVEDTLSVEAALLTA